MTGIRCPLLASSRCSSKPSMPGERTSEYKARVVMNTARVQKFTSILICYSPLSSLVRKFSTRSTHASASAAEIAICFTEASCEVFSNSRSSSKIACSLRTMFWTFVRSSSFIIKAASFRQLWKFFSLYVFR